MIKRTEGLIFLILIFSTFSDIWAQEEEEPEKQVRKYEASAELIPRRVVRGELVKIRIRTRIPWSGDVVIDSPNIRVPLVWWANPYARPWRETSESGRMVEVLCTIRPDKTGFYTVGSFTVRSGNGEARTKEQNLIALNADEKNLPYPIFLEWRNKPQEIWQGQAFPLILEARNLGDLNLPDSVKLSFVPAGILKKAGTLANVRTRKYLENTLYDVPVATWLWILNEPGNYNFPQVSVQMLGLKRRTSSFDLVVKPLPKAVQDSFAVGNFELDYSWNNGTYVPGDIFSINVRVSGSGNLSILKLPLPSLDAAKMLSVVPDSSYVADRNGYTGWREQRVNFEILQTGEHRLELPGWFWLEEGQVRSLSLKTEFFNVLERDKQNSETRTADILLGKDMMAYGPDRFNWTNLYWIWLYLPGPVLFLVRSKLRRQKIKSMTVSSVIIIGSIGSLLMFTSAHSLSSYQENQAKEAVKMAYLNDWQGAMKIYREMESVMGEWPGLLHDISLTAMELNNTSEAVYNIRRANYLRPGSHKFSNTLSRVEENFELKDQVSSKLLVSPFIIFIAFLVLFNSVFLLFPSFGSHSGAFREGRNYIKAFLLVIILVFLFLSVLTMVFTHRLWLGETAIVVSEAEALKKIPDNLASDWIQLPEGTAVIIKSAYRTRILVETGYGLEGWLPVSSLRFTGGRKNGF